MSKLSVNNLNSIIYESIGNTDYGWANYSNLKVIVQNKNGYINATKLCALKQGKFFKSWLINKGSRELLEHTAEYIGLTVSELTEERKGGDDQTITGTYVHPLLAPHIASWVSPKFAIKVSLIVNDHIVREYKEQIRVKDDKIDELCRKIDQQSEKLDQQSKDTKLLLTGVSDLKRNVEVANENTVCVLNTLEGVSERVVPPNRVDQTKKESFTVLHMNDPALEVPYYVIRAQGNSTRNAIARKRKLSPNLRVVVKLDDHPNSVELWNAIKTRLGSNMVFVPKTNMFSLWRMTEEEFVQAVNECDTEKRREYEDVKDFVEDDVAREEELKEEEASDVPWEYLMQTFKLPELKAMCRKNKWKGWSQLRKPELARFIVTASSMT